MLRSIIVKVNEIRQIQKINTLVKAFEKKYPKIIASGCHRNYCEIPAAEFKEFGEKHGFDIEKVYGDFIIDNPEFKRADFTQTELSNMKINGLDPNSKKDRIKFAEKENLIDELKKVPHFWNEYQGRIIDFTGYKQFVETGLASDLDSSRYQKD